MHIRPCARLPVFAALLVLTLSACASLRTAPGADTAAAALPARVDAPRWQVGSQWLYSDGYGLRVSRTDGTTTRFERLDDPRQWVTRRGFLRESSQSGTTERQLLFEDLPPNAGLVLTPRSPLTYRREYLSDGVTRTHATSWTVEGRQTVRVPAGEFDCIVLVMRTRSLSGEWSGYERWWFSPRAQNYVRMEYRYGTEAEGSRVLMRYSLAG